MAENMEHQEGFGQDISPMELNVMLAIWDQGAQTAREICDAVSEAMGEAQNISTISTYLQRLENKKYVEREQVARRRYRYTPLVTKKDVQDRAVEEFKKYFDSGSDFLHRFAGSRSLSAHERKEIKKLAASLKKWERESGGK